MTEILNEKCQKARNEYICMYCGCKIKKGEKYVRQRCKDGGQLYDFISHRCCNDIINKLPEEFDFMTTQDGVDEFTFEGCIDDYVRNHHYDRNGIEKKWNVPLHEQVKMILKELNETNND